MGREDIEEMVRRHIHARERPRQVREVLGREGVELRHGLVSDEREEMARRRVPVLCERPGRVAQVLRVELGHPLRGLVDDGAEDLEAMGFGDGEMGGYPREVGEVAGLELRWCALQQRDAV